MYICQRKILWESVTATKTHPRRHARESVLRALYALNFLEENPKEVLIKILQFNLIQAVYHSCRSWIFFLCVLRHNLCLYHALIVRVVCCLFINSLTIRSPTYHNNQKKFHHVKYLSLSIQSKIQLLHTTVAFH